MRWTRELAILALVAAVAAVVLPNVLGPADLDRTAAALALAGPAAGAALTLAAGRPNLAVGALAGVGAYVSGALTIRGVDLPLAVVVAVVATGAAGALLAVATARLDTLGLLAMTLLLAVGLAALTQALPALSGGQAGLGPLPQLGTSLPGGRLLALTPTGDLHATLASSLAVTALAAALLSSPAGARWRAVGSDRGRAAGSGLRPLDAEVVVQAMAGAMAGFGGALAAHVTRVATPDLFAADTVALPLLAALLAGRGRAVGATFTAVATGVIGTVVLPDLGWHGPPSAGAIALALLAVAVVASLLPGAAPPQAITTSPPEADAPWPFTPATFAGGELVVTGLDVRAGPLVLVRQLSMHVPAGEIHGLVGPNGAGKSSLLGLLARHAHGGIEVRGGDGPVVLQPQAGGGFPACTVDETLYLAARHGGRSTAEATQVATAWRGRLALDHAATTPCAELSGGRRRLLDLARVMLRRPSVLLCDEPLAGLDSATRRSAVSLLAAAAAAGLTIVVAEHDRAAVAALASASTELAPGGAHGAATETAG